MKNMKDLAVVIVQPKLTFWCMYDCKNFSPYIFFDEKNEFELHSL